MMRTANIPALQAQLNELDGAIALVKAEGVLLDVRIKIVAPGGTAGKPSQAKGYPRLIDTNTGKSCAIAPDAVAAYQADIDRGRELVRLRKRRAALVGRIDRAA
jgi:hypothetical protein